MTALHKGACPSRNEAALLRIGMLVGTVSVSGGGVIEAVSSLSRALARLPGLSVEIFSLLGEGNETYPLNDIPMHLVESRGPASFGYAPGLLPALRAGELDVLHVHGLWMYLSVAARKWAHEAGRPYLVSPHGMLDPWALSSGALKKRLAMRLYEAAHLQNASCLHALCAAEEEAIYKAGFDTPVITIPNGVVPPSEPAPPALWRAALPPEAKVLLFLGRVTPKKRVLELIRAFARTWRPGSKWHLVIVGPVEAGYRERIAEAVDGSSCRSHIHITGPAYGNARASAYGSADAFILPSISEGLPMAVLEAFTFGLPALLTPACNLPESFAAGAALQIAADEDGIVWGLERFFAIPEAERMAMGRNGKRLAAENFDWDVIARRMATLYGRLASRQPGGLRRSLIAAAGLPA